MGKWMDNDDDERWMINGWLGRWMDGWLDR